MPGKKKIAIIIASSLVAVLLFISFVLPLIVRNKAIEAIQQSTGRKAGIKSVTINPLTLTVVVHQLAIQAKDGGPFISIGRVKASLGLASIFRRALILSTLDINDPSFTFARTAPNQYSFSDIIERRKTDAKPDKSGESGFSLNNISITNGYVDFYDQAVEKGRKHTVRNLDVTVPFISNIPYLVEKYTDPKLSAEINGAAFNFEGKLKPLSKSLETSVNIDLKHLNLPGLAAYSPLKLPVELKSGKLTIDTDVTYRISSDKKPELNIKGLIKLEDIAADMPNGQPLVRLPELSAGAGSLEIFTRVFEFDSIKLDGLELFVSRDAKGQWAHDLLLPKAGPDAKETAIAVKAGTKPEQNVSRVAVKLFRASNGTIHFSDSLPKGGFKGSLSKIDLKLDNFSNAADKNALYQLTMLVDDASFKSEGRFSVNPLSARANIDLSGLKLQNGRPYQSKFLTAPVNGTLDVSSDIAYTKENGINTEKGKLAIRNLSTRFGKKDGFDLALFDLNGATFSQKENSLTVNEVNISKGSFSLSREQDGSLSPLSLLAAKQASAATAETKTSGPPSKESPPLKYKIRKFQMDKFNIAFIDKTKEEQPTFTLRNTSLSLADFNGPQFTPAQMRFASILGKKSPLKAGGLITAQPFRYRGNLSIGQLQISDFEDYFPENLNLEVMSGSIDTKLKLDVALKGGKPVGTFSGSAGIQGFHCIDTISDEDLLKWESLHFDNFNGSLEPFSLNINQIALSNFYSRIIIRKDGALNLQNLVEKPGRGTGDAGLGTRGEKSGSEEQGPENATQTAPKEQLQTAVPSPESRPGPTQIKIGAITLQGGTLNFTDNHLPQHFTTTFFNLGGRVSGLSSEETRMADVDLRGNLENHSPLQISGKINPLRDDLFVDLKISFNDIELSPVTPYSGAFLGYTVEKGKLSLDLKYHIEKKELNSENKIFIDQFTFGNKVESDKATSLPVKLGLALLKDRKGEIHLDVPVTGRTDDPRFSVWRLVFQALRNMLVKAVASPLSLLSSMFGGGGDLSTVQFAYGASALRPQEEQKLNALSKALADRPALKLELKGYVDREHDTEGYKSELLERKIRNEKYLALSKGRQSAADNIESVKILPEEYSGYLKAVYKKEKFSKPRNMVGLVKDLPDSEMKKLIITHTAVGNNELRALAEERNSAVMNYLVSKGNVDSKRVFQKIDDILKKPEKDGVPGSRVELNAIVR